MTATTPRPEAARTEELLEGGLTSAEGASWRQRAVERSLREARAKAVDRSGRFLEAATELLAESGRPDFTVQQLVERTHMSLRSFYQHFGSKDELLLVLFQEAMRTACDVFRELCAAAPDPLEKMRVVVVSLYGIPEQAPPQLAEQAHNGSMRALALYHLQLADQRPRDFANVLAPLKALLVEIADEGIGSGAFRQDLPAEALGVLVLQSLVSATLLYLLNEHLLATPLEPDQLWAFLRPGLLGDGAVMPLSAG